MDVSTPRKSDGDREGGETKIGNTYSFSVGEAMNPLPQLGLQFSLEDCRGDRHTANLANASE
jgi:hypothetical protein